jgi:hypothetical protein
LAAVTLAEEARQLAQLETDPHQEALTTWLAGKTPNTQQSYMAALREFLAFTDGKHPRGVTPWDVALDGSIPTQALYLGANGVWAYSQRWPGSVAYLPFIVKGYPPP